MPIDTSMYGNIKPFQVDSPLNALAQVSQVQNAQNQNALAQYTINKAKREDSDTLEVRNALMDTNGDYKAAANALMQRGLYKPAMEIGKAQLEQDKIKSEISKNNASAGETNTKTLNLKLQQHKDMLGPVNDPQSAAAWVTSIYNDPDLGAMMKRTGASAEDLIAKIPTDPEEFQTWKMQSSLSADKLIEYTTPNANTVASNKTSLMTTKMNNDTSRATNAATNATSRANNQANISKDFAINGITPDGTPGGDVETMAQGIASGKLAPIGGFALAKPRGQAIMARAMEINPNYDAGDYTAKNAALKGFSTGKEGTALRSFNVATDHLDTLGQMTDALHNGNAQILNKIGNEWNKQTGNPAPTNFDAVKEIVGKEVVKAIVAGGGGVSEREELSNLMSKANSPAQLKGVISHFKELMDAQRTGLMDQYQRTTGRTDGAEAFAPSKRSKPAAAGIVSVTTAEDYAKVPSGATYTTPDGSTRRKP
jgi:hypothetical protein